MEEKIGRLYNKLGQNEKTAFFSVLVFGLITHIHIFSVNYIFHDATNIDNLGYSYTSGRWMLGFMNDLASNMLGTYQLPFINGFISLLFIALAAIMIVNALEIKSRITAAFTGMAIVSFPSVASHFAFMFTATAYFLSLLLSVLSVFLIHKRPGLLSFILSTVLVCLSLGIYQAYLSFAISFALVIVIVHGLRHNAGFVELFKKGLLFVAMLLAGLILYLLVNKIVLQLKDVEMTAYQGLNKMGQIDLKLIPGAIFQAYHDQLYPSWQGIITSYFEKNLTSIVMISGAAVFFRLIWLSKSPKSAKFLLLVVAAISPIAFNSVYLMAPDSLSMSGIHALMRMSLVFTYILPAVYAEILSEQRKEKGKLKFDSLILACTVFALALIPPTYCYRDNTAYLNAELVEEQAVAYFGSMVTRIRSTEGYRDELPVAYIGWGFKDSTMTQLPMKGDVYTFILGLSLEELIGNNPWRAFCAIHLGWSPTEVEDISYFNGLEEVQQMPCYPDDGSIRIIDDAIVIKISEPRN